MRLITAATLAVIIAAGSSAAFASPFNANASLQGLDDALYATVLTVNAGEARSLAVDVDTAALQQRVMNNRYLSRAVESQGYAIDQIVGIDSDGEGSSVTLYVL